MKVFFYMEWQEFPKFPNGRTPASLHWFLSVHLPIIQLFYLKLFITPWHSTHHKPTPANFPTLFLLLLFKEYRTKFKNRVFQKGPFPTSPHTFLSIRMPFPLPCQFLCHGLKICVFLPRPQIHILKP